MVTIITEHIDIWTSVQTQRTNGIGRGNHSVNHSLHGIKKLRELILELAVRGKLVSQDPKDEPASVLLEKIAREKARLIKECKIKKQAPLPEITDEEKPFEVPQGWEWVRLVDLYYPISPSGKKLKSSEINETGAYPVVDQGQTYIAGYTDESDLLIKIPHPVIIFGDHTTERKYVDFNFVAGADGTKILCPYKMNERYFHAYLLNYKLENRGYSRHFKFLNDNLLALPPLAEQNRIVAKVDELMVLCGQLEQQQTDSNAAHQTLVETLLATLTGAANQSEFVESWQRIAEHFDTLFTTEQSIDQLKQTIPQLAVMGKLIPQDPNDEPASILLKKMAKEKTRLIKEGKLKKQEHLPEIDDDEKPFEIPHTWEWVRFGEMVTFKSDLVKPSDYLDWDQIAPDSIEKGTGKLLFRRTVAESGVIGPNNKFCRGQILYSKIRPSLSKAIVAQFDGLCSADMYPLEPMINPQFLLKEILSELFLEQVRIAENRVKMPKLNIESLSNIVISLPPLAEQHRIVAKVDELMAICDTLKARISDSQTIKIKLADAIVEQAVA